MAVRKTATKRQAAVEETAASAARPGRGPVDAPGKRHRKPLPREPLNEHLGEPSGKKMGQKGVKTAFRGGR